MPDCRTAPGRANALFCPPDRAIPCSPVRELYPSGIRKIMSWIPASFAVAISCVESISPNWAIFSARVPVKAKRPAASSRFWTRRLLLPLVNIRPIQPDIPSPAGQTPHNTLARQDFPDALAPTIPSTSPGFTRRVMFCSMGCRGFRGGKTVTFSTVSTPCAAGRRMLSCAGESLPSDEPRVPMPDELTGSLSPR